MATVLRLLFEESKSAALRDAVRSFRHGEPDKRIYSVVQSDLRAIPGAPFAYWVSPSIRGVFKTFPSFEVGERKSSGGIGSTDDFRFVRTWWEVDPEGLTTDEVASRERRSAWVPIAQGGGCSPFYAKTLSVIQYGRDGKELKAFIEAKLGSASRKFVRKRTILGPASHGRSGASIFQVGHCPGAACLASLAKWPMLQRRNSYIGSRFLTASHTTI